jgi:hypothetical protein
MPTLVSAMTFSQTPLLRSFHASSNSQGPAGQQIDQNIRNIRKQEIREALRRNPDLIGIFGELLALCNEEPEDDYGILRPTQYAFFTTVQLLISAGLQSRKRLPYGSVASDSEGGVRIEWYRDGREVRLVVPASEDGQPYIYHESDDVYNIERNPSASTLSRWLDWIANV